jgi:hypothetical protein
VIDVYLERGAKRAFAGAIDWPGWCRRGADEPSALEALLDAAPRYARALGRSRLGFVAPTRATDLRVVERLKGNATTDFGAPDASPRTDAAPVDEDELRRFHAVLRACWRALGSAADGARGRRLATGPRGGGRSLEDVLAHVVEANESYVRMLGRKVAPGGSGSDALAGSRDAVLAAVTSAVREGVEPGPRGGKRWTPRYTVRRVAWHVLDHAWEIEDRTTSASPGGS